MRHRSAAIQEEKTTGVQNYPRETTIEAVLSESRTGPFQRHLWGCSAWF